jgi:hypothetical protein
MIERALFSRASARRHHNDSLRSGLWAI